MVASMTEKQAIKFIKTLEGRGWDFDGVYGLTN